MKRSAGSPPRHSRAARSKTSNVCGQVCHVRMLEWKNVHREPCLVPGYQPASPDWLFCAHCEAVTTDMRCSFRVRGSYEI